MNENSIELLPISFEHILRLLHLPFHHRDPFDRIIITQAFAEILTINTKDAIFDKYEVNIQWK